MKRFVAIGALVLLLLPAALLTAGGRQESPGSASEPIQLRILWWGGQSRHDKTLQVIDLFERSNPGINVEPEYLGWDGYWDRLAVLAAAADLPDVFQMDLDRIAQYDRKALLADLYAVKGFDADQVAAGVRSIGEVDGRLLGICLGTNAYCLAYNSEVFDSAGLAYPSPRWTWSDLRAAGLTIQNKLGKFGLNDFGSDNDFQFWVRSRGSHLYSEELSAPGWTDNAMVVDFYRQLLDFQDKRVCPPAEYAVEVQSNEENSLYAQGQAGTMLLWSNKAVSVYKTLQKPSGLTVLPGPGSKQGMFLQPSMFFSIGNGAPNKADAAKFINFFLGDVEANNVLQGDRGVPVVAAVRSALARSADPQNALVFEYIDMVGEYSSPPDTRYPPQEEELLDIFQQITQQVRFGRLSPEQAAVTLREQWVAILSQ